MPDPTLSAAIKEAYAAAPTDEVIYHTLELYHPAFTDAIRVVRDREALDGRIEAGAARNPGEIVTFVAYAFDVVPPEQTSHGVPECVIEIDNASAEISEQMDRAATSSEPVELIYRAYCSDTATLGPENDPPLTMQFTAASARTLRIRGTAGFPDLLNRQFPALFYTLEKFPGLAP